MDHDGSIVDMRVIGGARRAHVEVRARHEVRGARNYQTGWILAVAPPRDGVVDFTIEPAVWLWHMDGETDWTPAMRAGVRAPFRPARGTYAVAEGAVEALPGEERALAEYDPAQVREALDVALAALSQWRRTAGLRTNPTQRFAGTVSQRRPTNMAKKSSKGRKKPAAKKSGKRKPAARRKPALKRMTLAQARKLGGLRAKRIKKTVKQNRRFARLRAKHAPRVELDGVKLTRGKRHTKLSKRVSLATRRAARRVTGIKIMHGDVRFNPTFAAIKSAVKRSLAKGKHAFKKELARHKKVAGRYAELNGTVFAAGAERMRVIQAVRTATGAKHGHVKWNPVLSHREGVAIMKRAAKLKRQGKRVPTKFVTPSGRVRTLKAAELRMQGKKVNRRGTGLYVSKKGRKIVLRSKSQGGGGGRSGGVFEPLHDLDML